MQSWFHNNKNKIASDEEALKELENAINDVQKRGLSLGERSMLRSSVIRRIRSDGVDLPAASYRLSNAVRLRGKEVNMPVWAKFVLKERVLEYVETTQNWDAGMNYGQRFSFKGYVATFLIVMFGVSILSFMPVQMKTVMAKTTVLDSVTGEVFVQRKNVLLRGVDDLELQKGDKIVTKDDGLATIKFFNDSVTRLNTNTHLDLINMEIEYVNPSVSNIEVYLQEGRMWATVIKLTDKSTFEVKTENLAADIEKKAAFDVVVKEDGTQLAVFNNVVKVKSAKVDALSKTVISGYQATAMKDGSEDIKIEKMMDKDDLIVSSKWVAANISSDDQYKNELVDAKEEEVLVTEVDDSTLEETFIADVVPLSEKALELKERFENIQKSLVSGEAQLVRGNREDGVAHLKFYRNELKHIKEDVDVLLADDEMGRSSVYSYMNTVIDQQIDDLSATLPGDRLYRAKEYLQEIEVNFARDEMERVEVQVAQAGDILLEMEDLINEDKANLVSTLLKRYSNRSEEFVSMLAEGRLNMGEERKISLIKQQVEQIKVLTAIQRSLVENDLDDLRDRVGLLRGEMLRKFVLSLDIYPGDIPAEVVVDVKDLYDTYILDVVNDYSVDPFMEKLSGDEYQMTFIKPDAAGDVGDDIILNPIDATPDVNANQLIEFGSINLNSDLKWDIISGI